MAKREKMVRAWVAVPRNAPHRLNAGYWLCATKKSLLASVKEHACFPDEWRAVLVEMQPAAKKRRACKESSLVAYGAAMLKRRVKR